MQRVEKSLAARRANAGLAVANSRKYNDADEGFSTRPKGVSLMHHSCVAHLENDWSFSAESALLWHIREGSEFVNIRWAVY